MAGRFISISSSSPTHHQGQEPVRLQSAAGCGWDCNKKIICSATLRRLRTSPNTIPRTADDPRCSIHRSRPVQLAEAPTHLHSRRRGTERGKKKKRKRAENASADARLVLACVPLRLTRPGIRLVVPSLHFTEMVESSTVDPAMPCSPLVSAGCRDGPFSAADRMRQVVSTRYSYTCRASPSSGLHVVLLLAGNPET
jgi:hypothetical protein